MIEAGATSTEEVVSAPCCCARPTRGVIVAPPGAPRNAEGAQSEGRVGGGRPSTPVQRGQQYKHDKGRDTPKDTPAQDPSYFSTAGT